jgi:hypothetical protein
MIGTVRISQLPPAEAIIGNETIIVNQDGDTRRTTASDVVGILTYVSSAGISSYADVSGISTISQGLTGNPAINVSSLNVSGVSTLGTILVSSGIVTATSGVVTYYGDGSKLENIISGVGIQSTGTIIGTGITTLNFIGAGNTFSVDGGTVNISIQGGGGGSQWVDGTLGISTSSFVGIGTTNPIRPLQVGAAGTNVFVVTGIGSVGVGTTNPNTKLHVVGDINLDDGGTFTTTLQMVTPTANRTISFPDQTGTVALVGGSSGQFIYNNAGAYAGVLNSSVDGSTGAVTLARLILAANGAASTPPLGLTGTWFTGGTATTTKPAFLLEPAGTVSTNWSTNGTGLGVNAPSGFAGNLLDLQVNGSSLVRTSSAGATFSAGGVRTNLSGGLGFEAFWGASFKIFDIFSNTGSVNLRLDSGGIISWNNGLLSVTTPDLFILRDAADTLAQRRGTNAQTTRVYNTFTSATNFERAKIEWASNILRIGTEKGADGGTARDMELQTDGTTRITVKADGAILFSGIPTSNPSVAGQLWNDGGTLKISAG